MNIWKVLWRPRNLTFFKQMEEKLVKKVQQFLHMTKAIDGDKGQPFKAYKTPTLGQHPPDFQVVEPNYSPLNASQRYSSKTLHFTRATLYLNTFNLPFFLHRGKEMVTTTFEQCKMTWGTAVCHCPKKKPAYSGSDGDMCTCEAKLSLWYESATAMLVLH